VEIVDEFTGRVLPGRRFTDGVHQAIEAKERVKVKEADRTVAAITFQNFFPMYEKLSGMSGTVMDSRGEFNQVYKLDIVRIPTNRPIARIDHNDLFFKTQKGKFISLIKKIKQINSRGQPVLVGARNVETAHTVSQMLFESNVPHQLLTAKDHRAEAEKIAQAGQSGMVTVATNMAGRGTDILLGPGVEEMEGMYVISTERHESRRIDGQLIGRSGRQGEPGESVFMISMEDEIMQLFGSEKIIDVMETLDIPEDEYISAPSLDNAFKKAQDFVESKNFDSRIYLYKYDSVTNFQRHYIYGMRDSLLENESNFSKFLKESIYSVVTSVLKLQDPNLIAQEITKIFNIVVEAEDFKQLENLDKRPAKQLAGFFNEWLNPFWVDPKKDQKVLSKKEMELNFQQAVEKSAGYLAGLAEKLKKDTEVYAASQNLILQIIDTNWSAHLEIMEILKEEASLLSYASEDPLIDYILEAKNLFENMQLEVKKQFLSAIFLRLNQQGMLK
jgi:preprotein translocase subunit SecA